jgi:hypothetical protein
MLLRWLPRFLKRGQQRSGCRFSSRSEVTRSDLLAVIADDDRCLKSFKSLLAGGIGHLMKCLCRPLKKGRSRAFLNRCSSHDHNRKTRLCLSGTGADFYKISKECCQLE